MPVYWYRVYGRLLSSELQFPELRETAPGPPAWAFRARAVDDPPIAAPLSLLGKQAVYQGCDARLHLMPGGWRITVDDTGVYDLTDQGRAITWTAFPDCIPDFLRAHLLGRVLATVMHFGGALVLHGSAVAYPGGAVLFLAPKHSGKSTLALALTQAGARLISDDTLAVQPGPVPEVWPGVHSLRLQPDAAERLGRTGLPGTRGDGKHVVADLPMDQLEHRTQPLLAIYLLAAAESIVGGQAIARRRLPAPLAAAAVVGQGKVSEMLGAGEQPVLLARAAQVVSLVPVYRLAVHHDLSRLPEVTEQLTAWHAGAPGRAGV
jgi:hypothetical protein